MVKISIVGAGSMFTRHIVSDILHMGSADGGTIALIDVDAERLSIARQLVEHMIHTTGKNIKVVASTDRKQVLPDTDFVINQIEVNGLATVKSEFEIPLKYGVKQCIGDTLGPGGLFKTLRTLPAWIAMIRDFEQLCPKAIILNYTNPMSAVTLAAVRVTDMPVVGLCHSIQNSSAQLASYLDVPYEELEWKAGGINHMSWFVELGHKGRDMYPVLRERMKEPAILAKDPVRLDAMQYLGAFVSESSGHFSEYIPYYRKRPDLIEKFCGEGYQGGTGYYANNWPTWRKNNDEAAKQALLSKEEAVLPVSNEYAPVIIDAVVRNKEQTIYGNVRNKGLVDNLFDNGIVEVACVVDGSGVRPVPFGSLPEHLAALCRSNMSFFDLAVDRKSVV